MPTPTLPTEMTPRSQVRAVLGLQWGDEGKGKLVDILMQDTDYCCRFNGGSNAGHTIIANGVKYALHLLPSGVLNPNSKNILGSGVVIHLKTVMGELTQFGDAKKEVSKRLFISDRATILLDLHQIIDGIHEEELSEGKKIGTTRRGIGPAYMSAVGRTGLKFADLLSPEAFAEKARSLAASMKLLYSASRSPSLEAYDVEEEIQRHLGEYMSLFGSQIVNTTGMVSRALKDGSSVLAEGANATMLDVVYGTYPFVTSSHTTAGGICTGLGLPPRDLGEIFGVVKAYTTRVGHGPFMTEEGESPCGLLLREKGHEYGTTTGRPRRCGWLDLPVVRYANALNGVTAINLTKLDVLSGIETLKVCTDYLSRLTGQILPYGEFPGSVEMLDHHEAIYADLPGWTEDISECRSFEELPPNCQAYVRFIEADLGLPCRWIGVGSARDAMIQCI